MSLSISDDRENARLTQMLLRLDERDDLPRRLRGEGYPMPRVSPNESLKALMEDRGLKHKDIWPVLGDKGTSTEILNGRERTSLARGKRG